MNQLKNGIQKKKNIYDRFKIRAEESQFIDLFTLIKFMNLKFKKIYNLVYGTKASENRQDQ